MSGKDKIIAKIIESAENSKAHTLFEANEKIKQVHENTAVYKNALEKKTETEITEIMHNTVSRTISVAELDVKKIILSAKHRVLDKAFSEAKNKALNLKDTDYKNFIKTLIEKYAEKGDVVIISSHDKKRIDKKFIDGISEKLSKNLGFSISDEFVGGIILQSKNCNKNLTLDTLMKEIRETSENKIAKILF